MGLTFIEALAGCGDGGGQVPVGPATVRTLAYVMTDCRGDAQGATMRQSLQIRHDGEAPVTVVEHSLAGGADLTAACLLISLSRGATDFARFGVFHRLGVAPDGSQVVFEVTDEDQLTLFPRNSLPTEQKGIFAVRADGSGVRRLSLPSRDPPYVDFFQSRPFFVFSPNGQKVAYTDRGPSRDNEDAVQIFTLDLTTGDMTQVTQLPPWRLLFDDTCCPVFADDETIAFLTYADVDGTNPQHARISVTVKTTDPMRPVMVSPPPVVIPGSRLETIFQISGSEVRTALLTLPGISKNGLLIREAFVISGDDVLQITNFQRRDTGFPTLSTDGQRVFFTASANPPELGTNPTENCQIWSTDRNGGDLRQLTQLHEGPHSFAGCDSLEPPPRGCTVYYLGRETQTDDLVFLSGCDILGTNPYGLQVFAMHQDGSGLRQLTDAHGYTNETGVVTVQLPYPIAYPGQAQF